MLDLGPRNLLGRPVLLLLLIAILRKTKSARLASFQAVLTGHASLALVLPMMQV